MNVFDNFFVLHERCISPADITNKYIYTRAYAHGGEKERGPQA